MKKNKLASALLISALFCFSSNISSAQLINQDIIDNTIENQSYNGNGGALLIELQNTITNSSFKNNTASTHGGAIFNLGKLTISDGEKDNHSSFINNSAHAGGAITSLSGSTLNIGNYTNFNNNKTFNTNGDAGGALYISDSTLNIGNNVSFSNNTALSAQDSITGAKGAAGAVYIYNSDVTIGNSISFSDNSSQYSSGGIYIWNNDGSTSSIGDNAIFSNNSSLQSYGGAIGNFDGQLNIGKNSEFTNNTAGTNGGAIANMNFSTTNGANITIDEEAIFSNNEASKGGAIYNDGKLTLNKATFTDNKAEIGGALYNTKNGTVNLTDVTFNKGNQNVANDIYNDGIINTEGTNNFNSNLSGNGTLINNGTINNSANVTTGILTNNIDAIIKGNGSLTITEDGSNDGLIEQEIININADNYTNNDSITAAKEFNNKSNLSGNGNLNITDGINNGNISQNKLELNGNFQNNSNVTVKDFTNNKNGFLTNEGNFIVNNNMNNSGTILNKGTFDSGTGNILNNTGTFINSGKDANFNATEIINNHIFGASDGANLSLTNINNDSGQLLISNNSSIKISNQQNALGGIINIIKGNNKLTINGNNNLTGTLNIGNTDNNTTSLILENGNLVKNATVNIENGGELILAENSNATFNAGDKVNGDLFLSESAGNVTLDNYSLSTGETSSLEGSSEAFYSQLGGKLNLINNSSITVKNLSTIKGGDLNIDSSSQFVAAGENHGGISYLDNLNTSGLLSAMNGGISEYNINNLNIGANTVGEIDSQADFTIDIYARSNAQNQHNTDKFIGSNITGVGTINISDWNLGEDIFGWDAPIDRDITLDNIFKYENITPTINLTATKKEVFTPIGWYQLNNHGGITGNYTLNLTRFNPQVYRGQVTTLAQYMNQLAVNDMLFNHSMLLPSFKDEDIGYTGTMANRYAATNPVFAPYQYSRKDGGLWYRMYGTFETLQMSQGLSNVGNNAYGTIIGADFGLKELKNGWKFMPTAYIGYNGAHQYFAGMGAYQNGGQAGFLGTWYKNNFILGGLIYGGVYQNSMDIAGHTDNTFNYFAGAATKAAYNWRFHKDWVLQPNLLLSYNFFGQQNWHSDFGQMGMMSGTLNGINLAPGLNLIWEKDTFSIYATLQYMYNLNGAVDGRAGNVSLPHLYMDRGYIQYGFGITKRFTDRCAGYFQTVFRNVGRTGVGFQLGFNIQLGK